MESSPARHIRPSLCGRRSFSSAGKVGGALAWAELSRAVIGLIVLILPLLLIGFSHYSRELHSSGASLAEGPGDEVVRKQTDFPPVVRRRKAIGR